MLVRFGVVVMLVVVPYCLCAADPAFQGHRNVTGGDTLKDCEIGLLGTVDGTCNCKDDKPFFNVLNNVTYGCTTFQIVCPGKFGWEI